MKIGKASTGNQLRNSNGFTLVEILIVSAILGILVLGSMQFMQFQQRNIRTMEVKGDLVTVRNLLAGWIENKQICDATFVGMSGTSGGVVTTIFSRRADAAVPGSTNVEEFNLGNQIPTTSWRVLNLDLLSQAEAQQVDPNLTGNAVNGIVTLLLRARLQQVRAGNVLVNANQDRGNFASVTRELFFPFRARVQEMLIIRSQPSPVSAEDYWNNNPTECNGTQTTFQNGAQTTLLAELQQTFPAATATNTVWQELDPSERVSIPLANGMQEHWQPCWATTVDVPIVECTPAGSNAGL
ncbi:MAG: type II secretion system GspH family protein [Bdellovibrionales bacterium]|nr:type II secretion system GspH family protein [Bdellovibrionales bacterium]